MNQAAQTGVAIGSLVGDTYQVTRLIGRGGMGAVFEANHVRLPGKRVAIKVLHGDVALDSEALARFRREAEIASRLGHPNIVEVHDFNLLATGQPYLVLELLVGESLEARLRGGRLGLVAALGIARQVAAGLAAAHREGVVHRDLKPQNVFLVAAHGDAGGGEIAKVLDFGISKIQGSQSIKTHDAAILGTPQYMAPEQALGRNAEVGPHTDVFALGVMLYEMLAGAPPFGGQTVPEVVFKVVYEQPRPLAELRPELPSEIGEAVARALHKQPDQRFASMSDFVLALTGSSLDTWRPPPAVVTTPSTTDPLGVTIDSGAHSPVPSSSPAPATPASASSPAAAPAPAVVTAPAQVPTATPSPTVAPTAPATAPRPAGRRRGVITALAVLALAAVTAILVLDRVRGGTTAAVTPATAAVDTAAANPTDAAPLAAAAVDTGAVSHRPDAGPATTDGRRGVRGKDRSQDRTAVDRDADRDVGATDPGLAAPLAADLAAGQAALERRDFGEAVRLAERVLRSKPGAPAAHALRAKGYCAQQDLGNARASLRNVPRRLKRRVVRYCAAAGVLL